MKWLNLLFGAALPGLAMAALPPDPYDTTVVPGTWCGNFNAAKAYSEQHDLPLVMVWGMEGCTHCDDLTDALWTSSGLDWASKQSAVFCFVEGDSYARDRAPNQGAGDFTGGLPTDPDRVTATPLVRFYWPARKSVRFSGRLGTMYSKRGTDLLSQFKNSFADFLSGIDMNVSFATLPMGSGDYPGDRLEGILSKMSKVEVPVIRTNGITKASANQLVFTRGDSSTTVDLAWAPGERIKFVPYTLPVKFKVGSVTTVELKEVGQAQPLATTKIWSVSEAANSPKNPYWLGERTAATLGWGDWTMDIDAVTNKVRAFNANKPAKRAYAMMFVGGSCWCPDCAMAEANVFARPEFKAWAVEHQVVFGVLDIPNNPQAEEASPSQLRYESYRTSDAYVSLRNSVAPDETQRYQSGAGYLSRHAVAYETALAVAERNAFLMGHDTLHGGWNRPERANKNRTGVPVFILLRDDGTVAARWNRFSDVGPAAYSDGYLRRFEEMLAQVDEPEEEADDDRSTTTRTLAVGGSAATTVSAVDQADVYRLEGVEEHMTLTFRFGGDAAELRVSLIDGDSGSELAVARGSAAELVLKATAGAASAYYLKVAPAEIVEGGYFDYTKATSTKCAYSVTATGVMGAGEFGFAVKSINVYEDCGTVQLPVLRANGCNGAASVKVRLVASSGTDVAGRIRFDETTLNWADGEEGLREATLTVLPDGLVQGNLRLCFELADLSAAAGGGEITEGTMTVNVYDVDVFGLAAYRHVSVSDEREIVGYRPGDEVELVHRRGELPEGLSISAVDGRLTVAGAAWGEAGERSASYLVILRRDGREVSREEYDFDFTVIDYDFAADIPSLASTRNYGNLPQVKDGAVTGVLTVTVPADGTVSARYRTGDHAYAYATASWSEFDVETSTLKAELVNLASGAEELELTLDAAEGQVRLVDPLGGEELLFTLEANPWPGGAAAWAGQYTVQIPETNALDMVTRLGGAAYMAMRMVSSAAQDSGSMLYAGVLPNGRAFYGVSTLLAGEDGKALLPFYEVSEVRSSPYAFSGELAIAPNASAEYRKFRWSVFAAVTPVWEIPDGGGRTAEFNVYGGYYDRDEISARFKEDFAGELANFAWQADTASLESGWYGLGRAMEPVAAEITDDNLPRLVSGEYNPQAVELEFSAETGVISGSFLIPFEEEELSVTYRGIVLPGWQGCAACSASGSFVERPWALGACSFSDRQRSCGAFRNGCEVRMDRYPTK